MPDFEGAASVPHADSRRRVARYCGLPARLMVRREAQPTQYRDHSLTGAWDGYRDARLEPDWIVV